MTGKPIKPLVWDAVDGRYGPYTPPARPPSLVSIAQANSAAAGFINRYLRDMLLRSSDVVIGDPMGLIGSAAGRTIPEWTGYTTSATISWWSFTEVQTRTIASSNIPRTILDALYTELEQRAPIEAAALYSTVDRGYGFSLEAFFEASPDFPTATEILHALLGG